MAPFIFLLDGFGIGSHTKGVDFIRVIEGVVQKLDAEGVRFALIGGFAMALQGVQRATVDLESQLNQLKGWYGTTD